MKKRKVSVQVRLSMGECIVLEQALVEFARGNVAYLELQTRLYVASKRAQEQERKQEVKSTREKK